MSGHPMPRPRRTGLSTTESLHLARWYDALTSPFGIECRVLGTSPRSMASILNAARRKACDPELDALSIVFPASPANVLWIVHKDQPYVQQQAQPSDN